jgi:hypothetical protein
MGVFVPSREPRMRPVSWLFEAFRNGWTYNKTPSEGRHWSKSRDVGRVSLLGLGRSLARRPSVLHLYALLRRRFASSALRSVLHLFLFFRAA